MGSDLVVFLDHAGAHPVLLLGGKGANLAEMASAKFTVPKGFVVTTDAYRSFLEQNGLRAKIGAALATANQNEPDSLITASAAIRSAVESSPVPSDLTLQLESAYGSLCSKFGVGRLPVAVRSSATAEDLHTASFAGQHETLLNVKGPQEVVAAVRKCWASLYTPRAIAYRARMGFGAAPVLMAVVVQRQIFSEKAGIGFTINPLSGNRDQLVVDAGYGQGESVVSGTGAADTFVLDKRDGKVLEQNTSHKSEMLVASPDVQGLSVQPVANGLSDIPCLNQKELDGIRALAIRLEDHYKYPQDFEWAIAEGRLYLLQTRPVTVVGERKGDTT